MRAATTRGKVTRERIAELIADDSEEFVAWACGDDEELRRLVGEVRAGRRAGTLF